MHLPHYVEVVRCEKSNVTRLKVQADIDQELLVDICHLPGQVQISEAYGLNEEGVTRLIEALLIARTALILGEIA